LLGGRPGITMGAVTGKNRGRLKRSSGAVEFLCPQVGKTDQ